MMNLSKIDRPPTAENWSRMQHPDVQRTAKKLFAFMRGSVSWNYNPTRNAAKYYIEDGIDRSAGLRVAAKGSILGRDHNRAATNAFFDYVETSPIAGLRAFSDLVEWLPIGPGAAVPIKPLSITRENGFFVPYFLNPWSIIAFDDYQASLYMTVLEVSLFRLTDFEDSPGTVLFLPNFMVGDRDWRRKAVIWRRGEVPLLTPKELHEQVRIFSESKEVARKMYSDYLASRPQG